jgi:hypothetical protein
MIRVVEMKLYLTATQESTLETWLRQCRWLSNQALEYRIKAYQRRGQTVTYNQQCDWLTGLRERMPALQTVPKHLYRLAVFAQERRSVGEKQGGVVVENGRSRRSHTTVDHSLGRRIGVTLRFHATGEPLVARWARRGTLPV